MNPYDMDRRLQLVKHLVGDIEDTAALNELLADPDLQEEYRQHVQVVRILDACRSDADSREQPDAAVVTAVLRIAASRQHRPRRMRLVGVPKRRVAEWSTLAMAAVIAGIIVLPQRGELEPATQQAVQADQSDLLLPWDEGSQLIIMNSRIEVLDARSSVESWDEPGLLRMDSLPSPERSSGFTPVSASE